jgi:hypothetical protein
MLEIPERRRRSGDSLFLYGPIFVALRQKTGTTLGIRGILVLKHKVRPVQEKGPLPNQNPPELRASWKRRTENYWRYKKRQLGNNVPGLDVPVYDAFGMDVLKRGKEGLEVESDTSQRQGTVVPLTIKKELRRPTLKSMCFT